MRVNILEDTVLNKLKYKYLYLNQFKVGNLFKTGIKGTIGGILISDHYDHSHQYGQLYNCYIEVAKPNPGPESSKKEAHTNSDQFGKI